ncbi:hypothetical protein [Halovivax ruber]
MLERSQINLFDAASGDALVHGLTRFDPQGANTGRTGTQVDS